MMVINDLTILKYKNGKEILIYPGGKEIVRTPIGGDKYFIRELQINYPEKTYIS